MIPTNAWRALYLKRCDHGVPIERSVAHSREKYASPGTYLPGTRYGSAFPPSPQRAFEVRTAYTCLAPWKLPVKITHRLSGVIDPFGSTPPRPVT